MQNQYYITSRSITPQFFVCKQTIAKTVVILQCSMKINEIQYVNVNFTLNMECNVHFSIGFNLWSIFETAGRIIQEEDEKTYIYITIDKEPIKCYIVMNDHVDETILGLPFFFLLGIHFGRRTLDDLIYINDVCYNNGITYHTFQNL